MSDIEITQSTLGEFIAAIYDEYMALYDDDEIATVATAATINELIIESIGIQDEAKADAA